MYRDIQDIDIYLPKCHLALTIRSFFHLWHTSFHSLSGYRPIAISAVTSVTFFRQTAWKNFCGISPMCTLTFVIAFIFATNKSAFYNFGAQRRKAAKIFACFLSGLNRVKT
jgi:hypothetical protein